MTMKNNEIEKVIDHLTQASYNEQRRLFPHIPAKDWGLIYGEKKVSKKCWQPNNFSYSFNYEQ